MLKRGFVGLTVILLVVTGALVLAHGEGEGDPVRGGTLFAEYCMACHGPQGEARAAHEAFAAPATYDVDFDETVRVGVEGTYMPAFGEEFGGPLSDTAIADISAYARTWQEDDFTPPVLPALPAALDEVAARGAGLYFTNCAGCHNQTGQGRGLDGFPPIGDHVDVVAIARRGAPDSAMMPPFSQAYDGPLSDDDLNSIAAYMRTWEREPEMTVIAESGPKGAGMLVLGLGLFGLLLVGGLVLTRRNPAVE